MICRRTGYFKDGHDRKQYLLEYGQMFLFLVAMDLFPKECRLVQEVDQKLEW
jgi:hypothetical protein